MHFVMLHFVELIFAFLHVSGIRGVAKVYRVVFIIELFVFFEEEKIIKKDK